MPGRKIILLIAVLAGCKDTPSLRPKRAGDAGPAVVVVEQAGPGVLTVEEQEPNDDQGQTLAVPGAVRGTMATATDKDRYALTVATPGTLSVELTGAADADLLLELQDGAGKRLIVSDNGPAGAVEGVPNLGVQAGPLRLVVREFVKKGKKPARATPASQPYLLVVRLGPPPAAGEELEPNDETAQAGELALGGSVTGYAGWRKDRDVWRVPLDRAGPDDALAIDVDAVPEVALRVTVTDGAETVLVERQGRAGEPVAVRNVAVKAGEPHYHVAVAASRGNLKDTYVVRATSAPFELDEEAEPNDSAVRAGPLSDVPNVDTGVRVGFLGRGDVDVFQLAPASGPRVLHATIEPPSSIDVTLTVVDIAGAPVGPVVDAAKKGGAETVSGHPVPAGAALYLKVAARSGASDSERYRLRWSAPAVEEAPSVPGFFE